MAVNYAQLGQLVANMTQGVNPNDKYAALMSDRFQAEQIAQAQRKAEKEAEKKKRKSMGINLIASLTGPLVGAGMALPTSVMTGSAASGAAAGGSGSIGSTLGGMTTAGIPKDMGIPSAADSIASGAAGDSAKAGAAGVSGGFSPIVQAALSAAPSFLGMGGSGTISGPPPVQPPQQFVHPSQAMAGTDFSGMRPGQIRRYAEDNPGALVQMQSYLSQGGELTPRQQAGMGRPLRTGLQDAGYDLASRGGLIRGALRGAFAPMLNRSRFAPGPDGNLYYQGGQ